MRKYVKTGKLLLWQKFCEKKKKEHPLVYFFWECTLKCNLFCQHCGSSCGPEENRSDELTTEEIKHAFKTMAEDFDASSICINVTGGEPLTRSDLFEVMTFVSELGFRWGMVSNGTLITPEIVEKLKQANCESISISLDGLEQTHNWLRNQKDVFERAVRGIKLLTESGDFNTIEVITCVNQKNFEQLDEIYEFCRELKLDAWRLFTITATGRAKDNDQLLLSKEQYRKLLDYIVEKRKQDNDPIKEISFCDEGFLGTEYEGEVRDEMYFCWAGVSIGSILYNGDIGACPILPREHTRQGNVRDDRFSDIWNNEFKQFRDREWKKCGACTDCEWWNFCEGNSYHLWDYDKKELRYCNLDLIEQREQDEE